MRGLRPVPHARHLQPRDGRLQQPRQARRRFLQRRQRVHADRHLSGRRLRGDEPRRVHGLRPVPHGRHLQPRDGRLHQSRQARRGTLQRRQRRTPGSCDPATGTCSSHNKPDGKSCDDGNACTRTDTCQGGTCVGANPVVCVASDQCHTAGACNPATGACSNPAKSNGAPCDDGNDCTQTDTCQAGACLGTNPVVCTASDQCHSAGTCNPATGACSNPAKPNAAPCNDGNDCTQSDTCQGGACVGTNPVVCTASDQCHTAGTCNPATGACSNPAKPNAAPCNDGNACTRS